MKLLSHIVRPFLFVASRGKRQILPPLKNDILTISATELAEKIRKRQISSQTVCQAFIDRIKEVNPILNAVSEERFDQAFLDAKDVDEFLSSTTLTEKELKETKPLLGLPFTVKETCSLKGMELSVGSLSLLGTKAQEDGTAVTRMKSGGAIPLLISNTPELCFSSGSESKTKGKINNPYNTTYTSGGSSSGEGALLGSGASIVGIGSDVGGSIRIPACFCGVFGHKPTANTVNTKGHFPKVSDDLTIKSFSVIGPLVRYAKDLKLVLKVLVEPEYMPKLKLDEEVDFTQIEIAFMEDFNNAALPGTDPDIKLAIETATNYLKENCGSTITNEKIDNLADSISISTYMLLSGEKTVAAFEHPTPFLEFLKSYFGSSDFSTQFSYSLFQTNVLTSLIHHDSSELLNMREKIWNFFGDKRILLFPTSYSSAKKHVDFFFNSIDVAYTIFANACGLPATNIPCGLDRNGMPIGIQVIAAPYQDRICLAVAEKLEKCFGGWVPPSSCG